MSNVVGPLGIDPVIFSLSLFGLLLLFAFYLLLPRGVRVHFMNAYPKRYMWAAKPRRRRHTTQNQTGASSDSVSVNSRSSSWFGRVRSNTSQQASTNSRVRTGPVASTNNHAYSTSMEETVDFGGRQQPSISLSVSQDNYIARGASIDSGGATNASNNEETMIIQQKLNTLRHQGVMIIAHGSRGKPKTVRLQLTPTTITWRTETQKRKVPGSSFSKDVKLGKLHAVNLSDIMYVDVGKQTTALKRVENKNVPENLCFSLLTKEGSLDLESSSARERDELVGAFSLVLDDVHNQSNLNWRENQTLNGGRSRNRDVPSSFDDYEDVV